MLSLLTVTAAAWAATISVPAGSEAEWRDAAVRAGLVLAASGSAADVAVVDRPAWAIVVRGPDGRVRTVPVSAPRGPSEREDLVLLASSLARPVADAAEWTSAPAAAVTPAPTRAPLPRPVAPTRHDAAKPAVLASSPAAPAPPARAAEPPVEIAPEPLASVAAVPPVSAAVEPSVSAAVELPVARAIVAPLPVAVPKLRAPLRPWVSAGGGGAIEPDLPLAGYGELAGGVRRDWLMVGVVAGAETARAPADLPATLASAWLGLRVGWTGGERVVTAISLDGGVAYRWLDTETVDPSTFLPAVAVAAEAGWRVGPLVVGPRVRLSGDLAPVVVRVGGVPRRDLSPFGIDVGLAATVLPR